MRNALTFLNNDLWSPLTDISDLQREMNRVFSDFSPRTNRANVAQDWLLPCDVEETQNQYLIAFDMPGLSKDDIHIELNDNQLIVTGERAEEKRQEDQTYHVRERRSGKFQRVFSLPHTIDADKIEANYKDGVLRLVLPKAESSKPRRIEVRTDEKKQDANQKQTAPQKAA